MNHFNAFMSQQRSGSATWLSRYPYVEKAHGLGPEQILFVDIGGGIGHQAAALRDALADVPNKVMVQDLPHAHAQAIQRPGLEWHAQDFWKAQVIHGARMYYLRNILHDYPDAEALQILANIKPAMGKDSVLLIDDIVIPDQGAHWQATQIDIVMMGMLAALERTETQWRKLLGEARLQIVNIYPYTLGSKDSLIECVSA
jgi:demethylsterigmatocystin 6-O-methyltransferase